MSALGRREFLAALAAGAVALPKLHASAPFPVVFKQQPPYAPLLSMAAPGTDEFPGEKIAMEIERALSATVLNATLPFTNDCTGASICPASYRDVAADVRVATYSKTNESPHEGFARWRVSLGTVHGARFHALPNDRVRYEIRSVREGRFEQRVGYWKLIWRDGAIAHIAPEEETVTHATEHWFGDVTGHVFANEPSFAWQLARGVPNWRSALDPACGIDIYGENGIAAADIDGDGRDEIYVCQPGGLPNRLYKIDGAGRFHDIAHDAGLDILDDTACALFVDLRNSGVQDVVLVRTTGPQLFFNDGRGHFTPVRDAFRFANAPQGSFTSVAAADYDRDGRLDLYFCCYVYYQSEAQYRYPTPYHDAQNGPPNFLFRNRLNDATPHFEDVTARVGLDHNNNRFSFAAAWCDYNDDGWPDLYVTNDFGRKNLYRNNGGHFRDVAEESGVVDLGPGMSSAWIDYDGDGRADLFVSNMWSSCGQRIVNAPNFGPVMKDPALLASYQHHVKGNSLYRNKGDGTFDYVGAEQGIEIVPWSWACDGYHFFDGASPELYVATGMLSNNDRDTDLMSFFYRQVVAKSPPRYAAAPEYENGWNAINQLVRQDYSWAGPEPNVMFARRAGRYYDFSFVSGVDCADDSRAFCFTDIDGDGHMDLVVKSRMAPQVRVYQNRRAAAQHAIALALCGVESNRDAIGARVEVDGVTKWITAGSAYVSQHTKRLHFLLGDRPRAARVRITWPSGKQQELTQLDAGHVYEVVEGQAAKPIRALNAARALPADVPYRVENRARLQTAWLWEPLPLPERRAGASLLVLHAGEPLPRYAHDALDLRRAPQELAAAYAIFRRYLFDYRADLATPFYLLIDEQSRVRKVYVSEPSQDEVRADLASLSASLDGDGHEARALPFAGTYLGRPARDYYKIGGGLLQAGYGEYALPYLEEMLRRSPSNAKALLAVGLIHLQAKRLVEARRALEHALELSPDLAEGWNELGGVESEAGNNAAALRCYERALALAPNLPYVVANAAQMHSKLNRPAEAERLYRRVLELDSSNADAANQLGLLFAQQGRSREAREMFERAIAIRRDDASAINNLGVLYLTLDQMNDAIAAFQYGQRVAPASELIAMNLARVYVRRGQRDRAADVLRELLTHKRDSAVALRALKELEAQ